MRRESASSNISTKCVQWDTKRNWLATVFVLVCLSTPALATQVMVPQGQMVRLRLVNVLTTENVMKDDPIDFEVAEDVVVATHVVIHKGDPARGKVFSVKGAGKRNAKDASVAFEFESVRAVDNQVIRLRKLPDRHKKGDSKENQIEANEPIPGYAERRVGAEKGKEYVAYVDASVTISVPDTPVAPPPITGVSSAQPPQATSQAGTQPASAAGVIPATAAPSAPAVSAPPVPEERAVVDFNSNPPGADILIDGTLVGNTPSKISVAPGRHLIQLRIGGYNPWTRQMRVEPGSYPSIRATLEKQ